MKKVRLREEYLAPLHNLTFGCIDQKSSSFHHIVAFLSLSHLAPFPTSTDLIPVISLDAALKGEVGTFLQARS